MIEFFMKFLLSITVTFSFVNKNVKIYRFTAADNEKEKLATERRSYDLALLLENQSPRALFRH